METDVAGLVPLVTTRTRGIGIGLALARRLGEATAASITVQSTPGQGSCFTVRFGAAALRA